MTGSLEVAPNVITIFVVNKGLDLD